ncbi:MAG: c-type cytochrome, partial [Steroidobacteraceae bacterium]
YCSGCHGDRAFGDPKKDVPALAGQRFAYLVRQLANFAAGERESTSMHSVVTQQAINDPQHWVDIAAYVNHLEPSPQKQTGNGEAAALGSGIFHEQCATCHGADATGDRAGWVPSLRQQNYGYLDKQMHKLAAGYRHNIDENLVLFMHSLDERDMEGTADYLSRLKGPGKVRSVVRPDGIAVN